jgi:hypothetical protein
MQSTERGLDFQKIILPKIMKHPIWRPVLSNYTEMEHAYKTVGNIAKIWQQIKGCHYKDDQRARNVIIPMVLSTSTISMRQTSLLTSIHRRNFVSGRIRRLALDTGVKNVVLALCDRAKRIDALLVEIHSLVSKFWCENTRASPIAKDIVRKQVAAGDWITHIGHNLIEL